MGAGEGALLPLCLLALLLLPSAEPVTGEDTLVQLTFFQESFPSQKESGEFLQELNEEETFHVDWDRKETVWRLPDITSFVRFDAQFALGNLDTAKTNMEILMKLSNRTQAQNGHFVFQHKAGCGFPIGPGPGIHFLEWFFWGRQEFVRFDSHHGTFEALTPLGEPAARYWNSDKDLLDSRRTAVDWFCRPNYAIFAPFATARKLKPQLQIIPMEAGPSSPHTLLVCSVDSFFPAKINITWLRNGQEEAEGRVVSTELIRNGDWTFSMLVMLEAQPERGDVYACQVEHASLPGPTSVLWGPQSDSARSKMWTGVVGLLLGLVFAVPGLALYLKSKKGTEIPPPAALLS